MVKSELTCKLGNIEQIAHIRTAVLDSGKSKGTRVALVNNGVIEYTIILDRAMDIIDFRYKGINIGFISKNGIVSSNIAHTAGMPFGDSFAGGFLYTCGLDNIGNATEESVMHGSLSLIPADNISVTTKWINNRYMLSVEGTMRVSSLFGRSFTLVRRITTFLGEDSFNIEDKLTNEDFVAREYSLLYHYNMGYPFLDNGVKIIAPIKDTVSRTDKAKECIKDVFNITQPLVNEDECVYYHTLLTDKPRIEVVNPTLKLRLIMEYNADNLPILVEWKSMKSGDYALGIEPATSDVDKKIPRILESHQSIVNNFMIKINIEE